MNKVYIPWSMFHKHCDITAAKVVVDHPQFDCIIALSRGGVVPARIMAETIKPKNFYVLGLKLFDGYKRGKDVEITQDLSSYSEFDRHDRILIVDDVSDVGTTLQFAYTHIWKNSGGAHVFTACPYMKKGTCKEPNYYSKVYSDDDWIVFPFEHD